MKVYDGIVVRVAYFANDPQNDHVTVRLTRGSPWGEPAGTLVDCYRSQLNETGPGMRCAW